MDGGLHEMWCHHKSSGDVMGCSYHEVVVFAGAATSNSSPDHKGDDQPTQADEAVTLYCNRQQRRRV